MKKLYLLLVLFALTIETLKSQTATTTKTQVFFEKIYLRTDREIYIEGENLWYSASLVNAQNNQPISTSNTLYVELVSNNEDHYAKKQIIQLDKGKGHGDFKLDEDLKPGNYILRAWTNWMRNFGDNFIFEKEIKILEKPKKDVVPNKKGTKVGERTITEKPAETVIQFFPEGGSLIDGVASVVAFKTNNNELPISGIITDNAGNIVTQLKSKRGSGTFLFKPLASENYQMNGKLGNGKSFSQKLPTALTKGYGMYVIDKDSLYQIIISTNSVSDLVGKDILLAGKSHGINCFKTQFTLKAHQQAISVYKNNFPDGIASITLYDSEGRPNCERLVYVDQKTKPFFSIKTDQESYSLNEKITVNIMMSDADNNPLQGFFSIAALDASFTKPEKSNITSYLMLESELRGEIENPEQYFDVKNADRKKQLDVLLLTQGWRDFLWKRIADTTVKISQIPESGITVSGTVKRKMGDSPVANSNVTIRSSGANQSQLFSGVTNDKGTFYIDGLKFTGEQKFAVTAINKKADNEGWIKLDQLFKPTPFKYKTDNLTDTTLYKNILENYEAVIKKNSVAKGILLDEVKVTSKPRTLLGGNVLNDMGYVDEEFKIFPRDSTYQSLSHYLLANSKQATMAPGANNHIVFRAGMRMVYPNFIINNREMFFMDDDLQQETGDGEAVTGDEPLSDIDTQIRDNIYDTYLNLSMSEFEQLTIKHMVGSRSIDDDYFLVYLTLKEGTQLGAKGNPISVKTNGYYQAREFNLDAPDDKKTGKNFTFYWNPLIETDKNGNASFSFFSPSEKTKIRLAMEGIESNGNPITREQAIEIK